MKGEASNTLPPNIERVLNSFVEAARKAFAEDLRAVVLYGSGAEGQLRVTSDVNLLLMLASFKQPQADQLREPLRLAQAAIQLRVMFLLESELHPALAAFAVKFADILRRRRVLYGADPFEDLDISRGDAIVRLKQTLLNLTLRLREAYVARGLREEQLVALVSDMAGPLRSCAASLLELEGKPVESAREALPQVAAALPDGAAWALEIARISEARQTGTLAHGVAAPTLFHLIELARMMWTRAAALS